MKNQLKRKKWDKIIKKDILVRVWDDDKTLAVERYLYLVRSKDYTGDYTFRVWDDGKMAREFDYDNFYTDGYKNAELVEPEEKPNTIPEIQEFCDKYKVWCAKNKNGPWFWFSKKPTPKECIWAPQFGCMVGLLPIHPKYKGDWTKTLHEPKVEK